MELLIVGTVAILSLCVNLAHVAAKRERRRLRVLNPYMTEHSRH